MVQLATGPAHPDQLPLGECKLRHLYNQWHSYIESATPANCIPCAGRERPIMIVILGKYKGESLIRSCALAHEHTMLTVEILIESAG